MSKLLSTEFYKLRRKFVTILVITIAFAVFVAFISTSSYGSFYLGISMFLTMFGLIICGITGVFISQDFTNNTIRNKLIIGHKRINIYLSYQIIFAALAFIMTTAFMAAYILSGNIFSNFEVFRTSEIDAAEMRVYRDNFFKTLPVYLIASPALTTLGVFISMTAKSSIGGVLTVIVAYMLNSLPLLNELDELFSESKLIEIFKCINQVLPSSQIFLMENFSAEADFSPLKYIVYSLAFAVVLIVLGYAIFRKADLK